MPALEEFAAVFTANSARLERPALPANDLDRELAIVIAFSVLGLVVALILAFFVPLPESLAHLL